jgi:membrane protein YdbS with pleckstrin-like domain
MSDTVIWQGRPSQWTNVLWFIACILVIPIPIAIYQWLRVKCMRFTMTEQRLRIESGILNKKYDDMELYRVKDTSVARPFLLRMVGLGTISLITSDASDPNLELMAISDPMNVHDIIRNQVEKMRRERGVRELDVADMNEGAASAFQS